MKDIESADYDILQEEYADENVNQTTNRMRMRLMNRVGVNPTTGSAVGTTRSVKKSAWLMDTSVRQNNKNFSVTSEGLETQRTSEQPGSRVGRSESLMSPASSATIVKSMLSSPIEVSEIFDRDVPDVRNRHRPGSGSERRTSLARVNLMNSKFRSSFWEWQYSRNVDRGNDESVQSQNSWRNLHSNATETPTQSTVDSDFSSKNFDSESATPGAVSSDANDDADQVSSRQANSSESSEDESISLSLARVTTPALESCEGLKSDLSISRIDEDETDSSFRLNYLKKLSYANVWVPQAKKLPKHQTLIIFDWDDTLFPTTFINSAEFESMQNSYHRATGITKTPLRCDPATKTICKDTLNSTCDSSSERTPGSPGIESVKLQNNPWSARIRPVEENALKLLTLALTLGRVIIITNAMGGWVEYAASKYMPLLLPTLQGLTIISARQQYEDLFPGDYRLWKMQAFLEVQKTMNNKLVTNLISVGDSSVDMDAVHVMGKEFSQCLVKKVKFREYPSTDELAKQLDLVRNKFVEICTSAKNLKICLEKKKDMQMSPHSPLINALSPGSIASKVLSQARTDPSASCPRMSMNSILD